MNADSGNRGTKSFDANQSSSQNKDKTVLLVDDDANLLRGLTRALADEEFTILTAICAAEARVVLARNKVDLVISDNLMVGDLGTEFLFAVHQDYPQVGLMMLSGFVPQGATMEMLHEIGISRILTKPCEASDVASAIREVFAKTRSAII